MKSKLDQPYIKELVRELLETGAVLTPKGWYLDGVYLAPRIEVKDALRAIKGN